MARPFAKIDIQQVKALASRGLTREQVSYSIGINPATYYNRVKTEPEIEEAYQAGKAEGIKAVANKLLEKAMTGDNTAMIFFLKCNGWKEENSVEVKNTTPINLVIKNDLKA
jgi:hypothetical protein